MTRRRTITAGPEQAIPEPKQAIRLAGASGRNGLIPPPEHRFVPGQSGNANGRPRKSVTAKQLRKIARQLTPGAVQRLVELVDSEDPKVAFAAATAILDRAYGQPVSEAEVESSIRVEADAAARSRSRAARSSTDCMSSSNVQISSQHGPALMMP
jgi:lysophospholipase L1-like esterase